MNYVTCISVHRVRRAQYWASSGRTTGRQSLISLVQDAGNSGVGRCVAAFARARRLRLVGRVRRQELVDELAHDADIVLLDEPKAAKRVAELTGGAAIKLAIDGVGGESTATLAACLEPRGTLVSYSGMSGNLPRCVDLTLRGFWLFHPQWQAHQQFWAPLRPRRS